MFAESVEQGGAGVELKGFCLAVDFELDGFDFGLGGCGGVCGLRAGDFGNSDGGGCAYRACAFDEAAAGDLQRAGWVSGFLFRGFLLGVELFFH